MNELKIIPESEIMIQRYGMARCLMIHCWPNRFDTGWLDLFESVFFRLGLAPKRLTARRRERKCSGSYKNMTVKLQDFLSSDEEGGVEIQVDAERRHGGATFFDTYARLYLVGQKSFMIAAHDSVSESCEELASSLSSLIFNTLGKAYGFSLDFPCAFGPDAYLVGVGCYPKSVREGSLDDYSRRITLCRDRLRHGFQPAQGYLREVYPVNFLLDANLRMPFQDRLLSDYMRCVGDLAPSGFADGIYRWGVKADMLRKVRKELEASGVILSSEADLLGIH